MNRKAAPEHNSKNIPRLGKTYSFSGPVMEKHPSPRMCEICRNVTICNYTKNLIHVHR